MQFILDLASGQEKWYGMKETVVLSVRNQRPKVPWGRMGRQQGDERLLDSCFSVSQVSKDAEGTWGKW